MYGLVMVILLLTTLVGSIIGNGDDLIYYGFLMIYLLIFVYFHFTERVFIKKYTPIERIQNKYCPWIIGITNTLSVYFLVFFKTRDIFTMLQMANALCIGVMMFNNIIISKDYVFYHNKTIGRTSKKANQMSHPLHRKLSFGDESSYTVLEVTSKIKSHQLAVKNEYVKFFNLEKSVPNF